jgi:transcriptional/translational regulatory protein YebC/TACO1
MFDRKGSVKVLVSKEHENHEGHLEAVIETALNNGAEDLDEVSSTSTEVEMQACPGPVLLSIELTATTVYLSTGIAR